MGGSETTKTVPDTLKDQIVAKQKVRVSFTLTLLMMTGCMPPVPYQAIANPSDLTKLETGYYSRPVYLQDGQHRILIPKGPEETSDRVLVAYKCLEPQDTIRYFTRHRCAARQKFALYRSAELTLENGYEFFAVLEREDHEVCTRARLRTLLMCARGFYYITLIIQMLHEAPAAPQSELYHAKTLKDSLEAELPILAKK